jgi:hypothetical protein
MCKHVGECLLHEKSKLEWENCVLNGSRKYKCVCVCVCAFIISFTINDVFISVYIIWMCVLIKRQVHMCA